MVKRFLEERSTDVTGASAPIAPSGSAPKENTPVNRCMVNMAFSGIDVTRYLFFQNNPSGRSNVLFRVVKMHRKQNCLLAPPEEHLRTSNF